MDTQSAFSPPEVHNHILKVNKKQDSELLTSEDVICWSIANTITKMKNTQSLRVWQGLRHGEQRRLWEEYTLNGHAVTSTIDPQRAMKFWQDIQESEDQSLPALYADGSRHLKKLTSLINPQSQDPLMQNLVKEFHKICDESEGHVGFDDEQETETQVVRESQEELYVEKPRKAKPRTHTINAGVEKFMDDGLIIAGDYIIPAFETIKSKEVNAGAKIAGAWTIMEGTAQLWVTRDFFESVILPKDTPHDDFHRKVRYVLTNLLSPQNALIISQYEAHMFLPALMKKANARLHLYASKTTATMMSFADLKAHVFAAHPAFDYLYKPLLHQINLFAGTLYLDTYEDYNEICHYLGVATEKVSKTSDQEVLFNRGEFIPLELRKRIGWPTESPFTSNPLPSLAHLLSIRHRGYDISRTHLGMLVRGRPIPIEDFDRTERVASVSSATGSHRVRTASQAFGTPTSTNSTDPNKRARIRYDDQDNGEQSQDTPLPLANGPGADNPLFVPEENTDVTAANQGDLSGETLALETNEDVDMGEDGGAIGDVEMTEANAAGDIG